MCSFIFQGENRFIESICQTIFSIDELLEIITDVNIDNNLKRPYLRFLLWVYLNTAGGMVDSGSADVPHDRWERIRWRLGEIYHSAGWNVMRVCPTDGDGIWYFSRVWGYIKTLSDMVQSLILFMENNTEATKSLMKKPPSKRYVGVFNHYIHAFMNCLVQTWCHYLCGSFLSHFIFYVGTFIYSLYYICLSQSFQRV